MHVTLCFSAYYLSLQPFKPQLRWPVKKHSVFDQDSSRRVCRPLQWLRIINIISTISKIPKACQNSVSCDNTFQTQRQCVALSLEIVRGFVVCLRVGLSVVLRHYCSLNANAKFGPAVCCCVDVNLSLVASKLYSVSSCWSKQASSLIYGAAPSWFCLCVEGGEMLSCLILLFQLHIVLSVVFYSTHKWDIWYFYLSVALNGFAVSNRVWGQHMSTGFWLSDIR